MNTLPAHVTDWWEPVNCRRQILINRKHMGPIKLTPEEEYEYQMLQEVAEAIQDYATSRAMLKT